MHFHHAPDIWRDFPDLVPVALFADGITPDVSVGEALAPFYATASARLVTSSEGALPEIQAWRRTYTKMGLKPTQYRCAAESLLRRFKKEGSLPAIHPLIDLCNAISLAFAIPIAVFDVSEIAGSIEVRRATGTETYQTFSGATEHPDPGEIVFADAAGQAHARRWTNRQSGRSAVRADTTSVLIVAEAMHDTASADIERLATTISNELDTIWSVPAKSATLTPAAPMFEF